MKAKVIAKKDILTTVAGAVGAAAMAAQPVLQAAQGGSLHRDQWFQLASAIMLGVIGWFTGKSTPAT